MDVYRKFIKIIEDKSYLRINHLSRARADSDGVALTTDQLTAGQLSDGFEPRLCRLLSK